MNKFKVGDIVVCVEKPGFGDAEVGKLYRVSHVDDEGLYVYGIEANYGRFDRWQHASSLEKFLYGCVDE